LSLAHETVRLRVYAQPFGFASPFFSFLENQKLRRNFQAWRAVGSNDLFDAWLLEADVWLLRLDLDSQFFAQEALAKFTTDATALRRG